MYKDTHNQSDVEMMEVSGIESAQKVLDILYTDHPDGRVPAQELEDVFDALGLKFGDPDVDTILVHMTFLDDGTADFTPLAKWVTARAFALGQHPSSPPKHSNLPSTPTRESIEKRGTAVSEARTALETANTARRTLISSRVDAISSIYMQYDEGRISTSTLVSELKRIGISETEEMRVAMRRRENGGYLPFSKFIRVLSKPPSSEDKFRVEETAGMSSTRLRNHERHIKLNPRNVTTSSNVITWEGRDFGPQKKDFKSRLYYPPPPSTTNSSVASENPERQEIIDLLMSLSLGRITSSVLRKELSRLNVNITFELDSLIRQSEADGKMSFRMFMKEIDRQLSPDARSTFFLSPPRSAIGSPPRSTTSSPSSPTSGDIPHPVKRHFDPPSHGNVITWKAKDEEKRNDEEKGGDPKKRNQKAMSPMSFKRSDNSAFGWTEGGKTDEEKKPSYRMLRGKRTDIIKDHGNIVNWGGKEVGDEGVRRKKKIYMPDSGTPFGLDDEE